MPFSFLAPAVAVLIAVTGPQPAAAFTPKGGKLATASCPETALTTQAAETAAAYHQEGTR